MLVPKNIARRLVLVALGSALTFGATGCGKNETAAPTDASPLGGDFSAVIAEVGNITLTRAYFDYRYDNLGPKEKARYSGEGWEQRFLDKLVEEIVVTEVADGEQYDLIREVQWRLDMARRSILYKAYYDRNFQDDVEVPEQELRDYYEQNLESFRTPGRVLGHHVMTSTKERIDQAWEELQGGASFALIAAKYSEDPVTKDDAGTVGWFNPDGFVLGLGFSPEFTRIAFEMEPHSVREPVKIGKNWHIIRIGAKVEGELQSFEEARERIERQLRPVLAIERYEAFVREKKKEIGVRGFGEFRGETRSADQIYELAAENRNALARRDYYRTLADLYPEHERADDALFMIGFLSIEEVGETGPAVSALRRLQSDYPESEFVEQLEWLIRNSNVSTGLRGEASPTDAQDALNQLQGRQ